MRTDRRPSESRGVDPWIGERLREHRTARQLSLAEVARAIGISVATLSRIETAKQSADVGLLLRLLVVLRVEPAVFFVAARPVDRDHGEGRAFADRLRSVASRSSARTIRQIGSALAESITQARSQADCDDALELILAQLDGLRLQVDALRARPRSTNRRRSISRAAREAEVSEDTVATGMNRAVHEHAAMTARVLLLDDDETIRELAERELVRAGFSIDLVADAEEGMRLLEAHSYTVVVIDRQKSGVDELLARLSALHTDRRPIVIVGTTEGRDDGLPDAVTLILRRPYDPELLIHIVSTCAAARRDTWDEQSRGNEQRRAH